MAGDIFRVIFISQQQGFLMKMAAVPALSQNCVVLPSLFYIVICPQLLDIPGVERQRLSVFHQHRAGIHTMAVELFIAAQCRLLISIVDKIPGGKMSPIIQPRLCIKGRILEKQMVRVADLAQTIGIIHPPYRR